VETEEQKTELTEEQEANKDQTKPTELSTPENGKRPVSPGETSLAFL